MRPTTATRDNVFDFQALLHPGTVFEHPRDVVVHPFLTLAEKRAILASWASDASIASCPALRAPEGLKTPVSPPGGLRGAAVQFAQGFQDGVDLGKRDLVAVLAEPFDVVRGIVVLARPLGGFGEVEEAVEADCRTPRAKWLRAAPDDRCPSLDPGPLRHPEATSKVTTQKFEKPVFGFKSRRKIFR